MSNLLLGVSGGIAAYKAADLASKLTQRGDRVRTLMTPNAREFITPLTFRAVTGEPVYTEVFSSNTAESMEHISLGEWADAMVIAPATADLIGRLAGGLGGDIISTTCLAFTQPVLLAPAMNDRMWSHAIVQENLAALQTKLDYAVVEPEAGHLACGTVGPGRLAATEDIIAAIDNLQTIETPSG
ncbi:MAG: flavoprotein [Planctomycetota bacterium]